MIGNPGVGKSTILNNLIKAQGNADFKKFESGNSEAGAGVTTVTQTQKFGKYRFTDTPGLSDLKLREQAAKEITKALKGGDNQEDVRAKVFFVITIEAGRIRPDDITTMQLVLESAPIKENGYGIIINKCTKKTIKKYKGNSSFATMLMTRIDTLTTHCKWIMRCDDLEDEDNALLDDINAMSEGLKEWILHEVPYNEYKNNQVKVLQDDAFERMKEENSKILAAMEKNMSELRKENKALQDRYTQMLERLATQQRAAPQESRGGGGLLGMLGGLIDNLLPIPKLF